MADITFECPECKQHLVIDVVNGGFDIPCPTCSKMISVPHPSINNFSAASKLLNVSPQDSINKSRIAAISLTLIGAVCFAGWFFGVHQPHLAKIKSDQEAERLHIQKEEQRKQQEQQSTLLRQQQEQQQAQLRQEQKDQAEQQAAMAADNQRAEHQQMLRDSDEKAINTYINLVAGEKNSYMFGVLTSVARLPLKQINQNTVGEPMLGDHEKVFEIAQFLSDKLNLNNLNDFTMQSASEAGCIGQSDLWILRNRVGLRMPQTRCEIFLLRDLDLSSGTIVTKTDPYSGRQTFIVNYKCANNRKRCVAIQTSLPFIANLKDNVQFPCADEQDAKKVGKALAALIYAYGGKGELIDASDSF